MNKEKQNWSSKLVPSKAEKAQTNNYIELQRILIPKQKLVIQFWNNNNIWILYTDLVSEKSSYIPLLWWDVKQFAQAWLSHKFSFTTSKSLGESLALNDLYLIPSLRQADPPL